MKVTLNFLGLKIPYEIPFEIYRNGILKIPISESVPIVSYSRNIPLLDTGIKYLTFEWNGAEFVLSLELERKIFRALRQ